GIALFEDTSEDRKLKARYILGFPYHFANTALLLSVLFALPWLYWKPHLSRAFSPSRAPPRVLPIRMRTMPHFPLLLFSSTLYPEPFCSSTRDIIPVFRVAPFSTINSINQQYQPPLFHIRRWTMQALLTGMIGIVGLVSVGCSTGSFFPPEATRDAAP